MITTEYQWISLNSNEFHWIPLNSIQFHWVPINFIEYHWLPMNTTEYQCVLEKRRRLQKIDDTAPFNESDRQFIWAVASVDLVDSDYSFSDFCVCAVHVESVQADPQGKRTGRLLPPALGSTAGGSAWFADRESQVTSVHLRRSVRPSRAPRNTQQAARRAPKFLQSFRSLLGVRTRPRQLFSSVSRSHHARDTRCPKKSTAEEKGPSHVVVDSESERETPRKIAIKVFAAVLDPSLPASPPTSVRRVDSVTSGFRWFACCLCENQRTWTSGDVGVVWPGLTQLATTGFVTGWRPGLRNGHRRWLRPPPTNGMMNFTQILSCSG